MSSFSWWIDGGIIGLYILATLIAGLAVRRYVGKVEHFLVAGREMNLYLGIASLAATEFGIVTCMTNAQSGYDKGFAGATPGILFFFSMLFVGWTGFCIKPLRQSGVTTIPELFGQRFGPRIRWLAGVVIVLGGLLNMGVFLRTGGEFLVLVSGLDPAYLKLIMTVFLLLVASYTILGGMLSVLITDFLQFVVMSVGLIVVTLLLLHQVGWTQMVEAVQQHHGAGGFNPLENPQMGWPYLIFFALLSLAAVLTWQTTIQRLIAAKDVRTGQRIYTHTSFFFVCRGLIPAIWGIAALVIIAPGTLAGSTMQAMPLALRTLLPVGVMGCMIAAMLAADMSTDSSYMLSWSSIIYNDVLAPFRRKAWSERRGLMINRMLVALIGIFLLVYGLWYELKQDLWAYLGITASIYLSSISVLLIACCYWRKANSWGAGTAIVLSATLPLGFLAMEQIPATAPLAARIGPYYSGIATYVVAALGMIVGSLLKPEHKERSA